MIFAVGVLDGQGPILHLFAPEHPSHRNMQRVEHTNIDTGGFIWRKVLLK